MYRTAPSNFALTPRVRPRIVIDVTLLPEPDSPTMPSTLPRSSLNETPSTALHDAVLRREVDVQVVDFEKRFCHYVGRMRGSRIAYARSTRALKKTMKNAPKSVTPMIGGRSKFASDCAAY